MSCLGCRPLQGASLFELLNAANFSNHAGGSQTVAEFWIDFLRVIFLFLLLHSCSLLGYPKAWRQRLRINLLERVVKLLKSSFQWPLMAQRHFHHFSINISTAVSIELRVTIERALVSHCSLDTCMGKFWFQIAGRSVRSQVALGSIWSQVTSWAVIQARERYVVGPGGHILHGTHSRPIV